MRVISQNGMIDVPYEMTAFHMAGGTIRMNMVGDTGKGTIIAQYSTQDKAEKAMQKLHNKYSYLWRAEHGLVSYYADETTAFRFPQEDEI